MAPDASLYAVELRRTSAPTPKRGHPNEKMVQSNQVLLAAQLKITDISNVNTQCTAVHSRLDRSFTGDSTTHAGLVMRTANLRFLHTIAAFTLQWVACHGQRLIAVPASSRYYGQDGPWGAVSVNYGGYPQDQLDESQWKTVDLFPGGQYNSFVISPAACRNDSTGLCGLGGEVASTTNVTQTIDDYTISFRPYSNYSADSGVNMTGYIYEQTMNVGFSTGGSGYTAYNTSTVVVDQMNYTTPSHKKTNAFEVGYLALGAGDASGGSPTQNFSTGGRTHPILAWNLPGYFWQHHLTPSFTYTLQVGSAAFQYPLSLTFGGYDMGRLIGPVTTFQSQLSLLDIGIGVQTGGSPFRFASKNELLIDSSGNNRPISVTPDPMGPYLSLPKQTCDAIASILPVKFDDQSGYYLWKTDDPSYAQIVASPAYLAFTLPPPPGNSSNVVLKIPFLLLNLTLGPLLSGQKTPIPYFPCMPYTPDSGAPYILGRAFLQAAFLGRNWNSAISWLAQAPGPGPGLQGLGTSYQDIASDQVTLNTFPGDFEEQFNSTWADHWKVLPNSSPAVTAEATTSAATSTHGRALSTNALVGIGAGAGAVTLAVISGLAIFFWRKRKSKKASRAEYLHPSIYRGQSYDLKGFSPSHSTADSKRPSYSSLKELAAMRSPPNAHLQRQWPLVELPVRQDPQEMGLRTPRPT
ncbi:hypothetical protein PRZ48_000271 [Zasmidium cellare]|uniref:Peptidase A1 domain-containing protein n=1 Tax=Zasmidium cellare TaxID=395010 RepID=A0ABR0EY00_ZASCE|nr:hypothetical protein PRZ48_000271 [Zasmidium cellare]